MFKSKYSNLLTLVLIIAIIAILSVTTILIVNVYKKYKNNKQSAEAISNFDDNINYTIASSSEETEITDIDFKGKENNTNLEDTSENKGIRKVTYYNNFVMLGYIEIPKIKIKYPILEEETVSSLEQSVAVRYPLHTTLNEIGNVVIAGHNYRNGMFFSNLKKVSTGDIIKITDTNGKRLNYKIYEIYTTTPEDTEYITRDVGNEIEVTLVTCTDDSSKRIIVKARVQ